MVFGWHFTSHPVRLEAKRKAARGTAKANAQRLGAGAGRAAGLRTDRRDPAVHRTARSNRNRETPRLSGGLGGTGWSPRLPHPGSPWGAPVGHDRQPLPWEGLRVPTRTPRVGAPLHHEWVLLETHG